MGPLKSLIKMIPGANKINEDDIDESAIGRTEAIIYSMTPREREKPEIINPSRKRRIAAGCGMKVEDVNRLLKQYEQMKKMIKQVSKPGKRGKMPRFPGGMNGFGM